MPLTSNTSWEDAADQLTTLPSDLQEEFGSMNFMRAGRFRTNGRALFEKVILTITTDTAYEVLVGYVDHTILDKVVGATALSTKFASATLRNVITGDVITVELA